MTSNRSSSLARWLTPFVLLLLACCALYVSYRTVRLEITTDEIDAMHSARTESYGALLLGRDWNSQAHFLNVLLAKPCLQWLPLNEIVANRLPSLLGLALFLWGVWRIGVRFPTAITRLLVTLALLSNPFVLDYLGLSRGYGLGLGFTMLSLSFLLEACSAPAIDDASARRSVNLSLWLAFGAALSTMAFMHFYVVMLLAVLWLTRGKGLKLLGWSSAVALGVFYFRRVAVTRSENQLYFGGDVGFVHDTVGSLVRCSFYDPQLSARLVEWVAVVMASLALILAGWSYRERIRAGFALSLIGIGAALVSFSAHALLEVKYPVERVALYLVPTFLLNVAVVAAWSQYRWPRRLLSGLLLAVSVVGLRQVNLTHTFNSQSPDIPPALLALQQIHKETGRHVLLAHSDGFKWVVWYYAEHLLALPPKPSAADGAYLKTYGWLTVYEWRGIFPRLRAAPQPLLPGTTHLLLDRQDEHVLTDRLPDKITPLQHYPISDLTLCRLNLPGNIGTFTSADGTVYVGEFRDGRASGRGTCTYPDGKTYVGEFVDGDPNGMGTVTTGDGQRYVGELAGGKPNGHGTIAFPDGRTYEGQFKDDKPRGSGTLTWPDGQRYAGEFEDGVPNGQGTTTFSDGQRYVGQFRAGKPSGSGTETWPDGRSYVGEFEDGEPSGQGTATFPDRRKYAGQFKDGKPNGQGTLNLPDGRQYIGQFKDGAAGGTGKMTYPDGRVEVGQWKDNEFVGASTSP
ncbi:MAG TPA: hypothetical protein VMV72_07655 [Verrucomicrobiae bacterium]|nr:hypothetical protein [Verrucomicrobiae bacterium]